MNINISQIDHISLSVTDLEKSAYFYRDILGFTLNKVPNDYVNALNAGSYYFSAGNIEITLLHHVETMENDKFSEFRVGLDHISFRVDSEHDLQNLVEILNKHNIPNSGIATYSPNKKKYVVVRDPDNIQLEYWLDK